MWPNSCSAPGNWRRYSAPRSCASAPPPTSKPPGSVPRSALGAHAIRDHAELVVLADAILPGDRRVALHRLFPTRADVVSALLASFHWGVPVVTYEPKAYVGTNGILYGDVLEIEDP